MIHESVATAQLHESSEALISTLAAAPTVALGLTKALLDSSSTASLESQLQDEAFSLELSSRSEDFKEGLAAFSEKRDPNYKGR
jgi:2-(1,2-epoxy-1,2-dihydrophenyl)acetyl-CoA isomerase